METQLAQEVSERGNSENTSTRDLLISFGEVTIAFIPQDSRCFHLNNKEKGDLARGHPGDRVLGNMWL